MDGGVSGGTHDEFACREETKKISTASVFD